ncbi:winged helix-turn-helix transcriptional regulator [Cyanobium sp. HWJ4-Hawea]|uniref:ArsR/SmtB family transcription factor n=1 Tax=unclassified Cyanobium TaxID=2627006 RepID=UPI0020CED335|nr:MULTISPECIES: metalloregulator ArsR/SmtB family transcription factor [unclassified Cyanobium]MCP9774907.1 winged helix-turn-helix transcriptional regulator [Cyanobium sp. WAJ14-Wanaka]MCP9808998.1 winged helix-turn-helix transcriptional regulator [Cyanobium sp. HWJ4-Hawea]
MALIAIAPLSAEQARALLKALADPLRLQILDALGPGERCVCDLTADLGLAQSKLSFHLKVLKDAGLLLDRQEGRWVFYQLQPQAIGALQGWLDQLAQAKERPSSSCC